MAIRVSVISEAGETVLRVDGHLKTEDVDELAREYRSVKRPPVLDLSNLNSADSAGVDCLRQLIVQGAHVRGTSPYLDLLLESKP